MTSLKRCERASPTRQSLTIPSNLYHSCFSDLPLSFPSILSICFAHPCFLPAFIHHYPMPPNPNVDDPWSDSDEELDAGLETAVQLGIPDGPLSSPTDILDPAVSRIGGHPVRCPFALPCTFPVLIASVQSIRLFVPCVGIPVRFPPSVRQCKLQSLHPAHGASDPDLVPARGQPKRPRAVRLGMRQWLLSA